MNTEETFDVLTAEEDSMIPDGMKADDILSVGDTDEDYSPRLDSESEEAPTTEQEADEQEDEPKASEETEEKPEAPTTEQKDEPKKLRIRAKIDHKDVDVDIDESDLPALYQKAQNHDRMQQRIAHADAEKAEWETIAQMLGYESAEEMRKSVPVNFKKNEVKKLVDDGVNEDVAEEVVESRFSRKFGAKTAKKQSTDSSGDHDTEASGAPAQRDYNAELTELCSQYPDMRGKTLPDSVVQDMIRNGKTAVSAYRDYLTEQQEAETEKTKNENRILKQNAAASAKAPVKGVGAGAETSRGTKIEQALLRGFESDD